MSYLKNTLLFEKSSFNDKIDTLVLDDTIDYILSTRRFAIINKYVAIKYDLDILLTALLLSLFFVVAVVFVQL